MSVFLQSKGRWLDENALAFCIDQKGYEVSPGHCLVCPKRHVPTVFDMTDEEWGACVDLVCRSKVRLDRDKKPDGYNVGINCGQVAGQTVDHAHIHIIPRYAGDDPDPRGGIRACVPGGKVY